jgi:uncharacterized membrane protein
MSRARVARALGRPSPLAWVALMAAVYASVFASLSIARLHAFWAGRFDLGNMVQAVWSTAQGRPLETTDMFGSQFVRLGAHVDPLLVLFTPLTWTGHLPEALLIAQALIVAVGAFPAYLLGRRWLGGAGFGVAAAAVYLLYPPLQWAVVTDFHPVTLAAPLLMFCIWAAEERRWVVLGVCAPLAAMSKEQVGLAVAMLGLWLAVRGARRAGALLAAGGIAWSLFAVLVVIPRFNRGEGSAFVARYAHLGDTQGEIVTTILTRPWEVAELLIQPERLAYLAALLLPLLLLPLAAPLLAAGALPDLAINMLSDLPSQHQIHFHYAAVIAPFFVCAAILGLARVRTWSAWPPVSEFMARPGRVIATQIAAVAIAGVVLGPLPWWSHVPFGSDERAGSYTVGSHAAAARAALGFIPDDVPVSAGNTMGAHLSERERIHTFPVIADAEWIVVDSERPYLGDRRDPRGHAARLALLHADPRWRVVYARDGVMVFRHVTAGGR